MKPTWKRMFSYGEWKIKEIVLPPKKVNKSYWVFKLLKYFNFSFRRTSDEINNLN